MIDEVLLVLSVFPCMVLSKFSATLDVAWFERECVSVRPRPIHTKGIRAPGNLRRPQGTTRQVVVCSLLLQKKYSKYLFGHTLV